MILPLRTIALQTLFLWVAIAIESYIFHAQLNLHRRFSIFYATTLNLVANLMGWFLFFNLERLLPDRLRQTLIDFIILGDWDKYSLSWVLLGGIAGFLISWFVKRRGLAILRNIRKLIVERKRGEGGFSVAASEAFIQKTISRTIFNAHLSSNTVIFIMILIQFIKINI